jgi:hypothetical protein
VAHAALIGGLLLTAGCAEMYPLMELRSALSREFPEAGIGVSLSDGLMLTVTMTNGPSPAAPCDSQAAFALRVAEYVRHSYQHFDSLQTVSISFVQRASGDPARATSTHLPFRFSRAALETGQLAADSTSAVTLCELDAPPPTPGSP